MVCPIMIMSQMVLWPCLSWYYDHVSHGIMTMSHMVLWPCLSWYYDHVSAGIMTMFQMVLWPCLTWYYDHVSHGIMTMSHMVLWPCLTRYYDQWPCLYSSFCKNVVPATDIFFLFNLCMEGGRGTDVFFKRLGRLNNFFTSNGDIHQICCQLYI